MLRSCCHNRINGAFCRSPGKASSDPLCGPIYVGACGLRDLQASHLCCPTCQAQLLHGAGWSWPFSGYTEAEPTSFLSLQPPQLAGPGTGTMETPSGRKEPSEAAPPKLNLPPGHLDPVPHECLPQRRQPGEAPGVVDKHLRWYGLQDLGRPCGSGACGPTPLLERSEPPQEGHLLVPSPAHPG